MSTDTQLPPPPPQQVATPQKNTIGLIALITAIVGAIFAVIPGALIVGWVLLPIAFVLAIISFFLKNQKRGQGIAALIISILGFIIGLIAFFMMVGSAIDEAFSDTTEIQTPTEQVSSEEDTQDSEQTDSDEADAPADAPAGTREAPLPIGSTITTDDWEVTVNSVNLDATDELSQGLFNDAPAAGNGYIVVNLTATYIGSDPEGSTPWASVEFVSTAGNTYDGLSSLVIADDSFDSMETLYEGASTTGDKALEVPLDDIENGTLRVSPDLFADDKFFAVQ